MPCRWTIALGVLGAVISCTSTPVETSEVVALHNTATPIEIDIPGSVHVITMVPISRSGDQRIWISATEMTWDVFDLYIYGNERDDVINADAITRPTKPYISMDRGFGRTGYPAISMSFLNASNFCQWLSRKTGKRFRLPTLDQWREVCRQNEWSADRDACAWHAGNSDGRTHPVGSKSAGELLVFDMLGNAAEWVVDVDGNGVVVGGSYRDAPDRLSCDLSIAPSPDWNASDPQFPKSKWWLADAPFVGFRVLMEE